MLSAVIMAAALSLTSPAAPPTVDFPLKLEPVGQFAIQDPGPDVVSAVYIPVGHANDPFPLAIITKDPDALRKFVFDRRGLPDGSYGFIGVFAGKTGEQKRIDFAVNVGKLGTPPVVTPPVTGPAIKFYAIIRADGPSAPAWSLLMKSSAWDDLAAKKYQWKEYVVSEAEAVRIPIPAKLPAMIVYKKAGEANGKPIWVQDGEVRTPPSSEAEIRKLAE